MSSVAKSKVIRRCYKCTCEGEEGMMVNVSFRGRKVCVSIKGGSGMVYKHPYPGPNYLSAIISWLSRGLHAISLEDARHFMIEALGPELLAQAIQNG